VPLRTELKNGDVVEVVTAPVSTPNPAWLGFVRTGRARSKIRHHLKTMAHAESQELGLKLLAQALRAEGIENLPGRRRAEPRHLGKAAALYRQPQPRRAADRLGLGKRIASIVAKRLMTLMTEGGEKPNALLLTRERYTAHESVSQGSVMLDGSENASVQYAPVAGPFPVTPSWAIWAVAKAWWCMWPNAPCRQRLQHKDSERFIAVEWSDDPVRTFETSLIVTVTTARACWPGWRLPWPAPKPTSPTWTWATKPPRTPWTCAF
jgi:guanosine-3',5'-bis(diphosphate) 3'-pyrophosphohydrolase